MKFEILINQSKTTIIAENLIQSENSFFVSFLHSRLQNSNQIQFEYFFSSSKYCLCVRSILSMAIITNNDTTSIITIDNMIDSSLKTTIESSSSSSPSSIYRKFTAIVLFTLFTLILTGYHILSRWLMSRSVVVVDKKRRRRRRCRRRHKTRRKRRSNHHPLSSSKSKRILLSSKTFKSSSSSIAVTTKIGKV